MKYFYQQIWCIGILLEGEFVRAEVISTYTVDFFRYFLWTTKSKAIDILFLP